MPKSKIDNAEFKRRWDDGEDIDPDDVEDETLKGLYLEALAMWQDVNEITEKIERYLDASSGRRYEVHGESHEDFDKQPDRSRLRFFDSGTH